MQHHKFLKTGLLQSAAAMAPKGKAKAKGQGTAKASAKSAASALPKVSDAMVQWARDELAGADKAMYASKQGAFTT